VLLGGHFDNLRHLVLPLGDKLLYVSNDLVHDVLAALDLDGVAIRVLLGELDGPCELPAVVRAPSLDDNISEVGT
jgi:hypothetical protein